MVKQPSSLQRALHRNDAAIAELNKGKLKLNSLRSLTTSISGSHRHLNPLVTSAVSLDVSVKACGQKIDPVNLDVVVHAMDDDALIVSGPVQPERIDTGLYRAKFSFERTSGAEKAVDGAAKAVEYIGEYGCPFILGMYIYFFS